MFETTRPTQKRRKSRCSSADHAEVRPGSAAAASSSPSASSSEASSSRVTARVHGSRTHHGTYYAPSTVLKTEGLTGAPALSCAFPTETRDSSVRRRSPEAATGRRVEEQRVPIELGHTNHRRDSDGAATS